MAIKQHQYTASIAWTGNRGTGTSGYRDYARNWSVRTPGKPEIHCSNDPLLGGDPALHNPEDMLLAALSACHMLWYLHLASDAGIVVTDYHDNPVALSETSPDGTGRFVSATLHPHARLAAGADLDQARAIHGKIHAHCFIARSVNFPVEYEPTFEIEE